MSGVARSTIHQRAKREGWDKDLADNVADAIRDRRGLTVPQSPDEDLSGSREATDAELVERAALTTLMVLREHKSAIHRARGIVETICDDLSAAVMERREIRQSDAQKPRQQHERG